MASSSVVRRAGFSSANDWMRSVWPRKASRTLRRTSGDSDENASGEATSSGSTWRRWFTKDISARWSLSNRSRVEGDKRIATLELWTRAARCRRSGFIVSFPHSVEEVLKSIPPKPPALCPPVPSNPTLRPASADQVLHTCRKDTDERLQDFYPAVVS